MKDRLAELPDNVLHSIISLLPMRDAVRTTILSRKWSSIGKFLPNLDFQSSNILGNRFSLEDSRKLDCEGKKTYFLERKLNFVRAVNQFLQLRSHGMKIESMRICFSLGVDHASHLDRWIEHTFASGIEKLDIELIDDFEAISLEKYYVFPLHKLVHEKVACLSSLKILRLQCLVMRHPPDFYGLKSLTTLSLDDVDVTDGDILKILSKCPLLEQLYLWSPSFINLDIPSCCSRLKYLDVKQSRKLENVSINAPNVTNFIFCGDLINFSFVKVTRIEHIELIIIRDCSNWIKYVVTKSPQLFPQLESLQFTMSRVC
ncbi:F-box/LRR-repeat protein [Acorus gramineus]|uniref:F-box/LRR-repeat protein n=1 Tax=Acorus gramineus TaxID=55184 RepID=A0AAV9A6I7_ACOGR|nr:F-box/LRR-repeat protein [Acorus gramineus]